MSEDSKLKKICVYGFGILMLLGGLGGMFEGGLGLLGGPILIVTSLLLIPKTRPLITDAIDSAGGPDLSTLGRSAFIGLIIVGFVVGGALLPAADTPETEGVETPPSPSNSTDSPGSTSEPSSGDLDSTSDSSTDESTDLPSSSSDDSSGTSSGGSSNSPSEVSTDDSSGDTTSESPDDTTSDSSDPSTDSGQETSWTVSVLSITDGDTMDVRMPDGTTDTIRLLGVDTPETSAGNTDPTEWEGIPDNADGREWLEQWGGEASEYAEDRLAGEEIYIEVDEESDRRGTYDRLLVYAYQSESSSTSFNLRLIENGYARMYDSQFSQRSTHQSAESEAQNNNVGVWDYSDSSSTPSGDGGSQNGDIVVSTIHADANGNDHENLNEEYIELTNEGSSSVDMTGWTVSDDADHTYHIPSGFTLDAGESVIIYSGSGSDTDTELYWGSGSAIWNNSGDTIIVTNADGETVINREY
ncbi:lamin tail domain-containing protein [Halopiger aswanensis]|uniref:Endonuclease YncB(Thermonuclease family) n=1 Tax=Halopiger aswanensis TaxID=148449 RepID=A0A419VUJ9_9EURY|nr:lamin tail domain-containing protein [Halopiger aswanensis]RKD85200.1 endonuclease YncB(thermonuclease family) [Halopiger aswanensis]